MRKRLFVVAAVLSALLSAATWLVAVPAPAGAAVFDVLLADGNAHISPGLQTCPTGVQTSPSPGVVDPCGTAQTWTVSIDGAGNFAGASAGPPLAEAEVAGLSLCSFSGGSLPGTVESSAFGQGQMTGWCVAALGTGSYSADCVLQYTHVGIVLTYAMLSCTGISWQPFGQPPGGGPTYSAGGQGLYLLAPTSAPGAPITKAAMAGGHGFGG